MNQNSTILLTGAAGFIGSYMTGYLNKQGFENLILVDEFPASPAGGDEEEKELNLHTRQFKVRVERDDLFEWLEKENPSVGFVLHIGARTDTTEFDYSIHEKLNVEYSKKIWNYCVEKNIPLIYASSAATYGSGEFGYKDDHDLLEKLKPLNPYGVSKNEFDKWVIKRSQESRRGKAGRDADRSVGIGSSPREAGQESTPPFWFGLKFFNVYGPNEYHKSRMASVVFHAFNQIQATGKVKLFKSHKPEFKDGGQLRDFIYVEDVCKVMFWMMNEVGGQRSEVGGRKSEVGGQRSDVRSLMSDVSHLTNGIYNLGTGKARTFIDLVTPIFITMNLPSNIEFIDMPADIRDKYQYFTEADMHKLRTAGYKEEFYSVENGVSEYVKNYLLEKKYY